MTLIDVLRETIALTDAEAASACTALQRQLTELGHMWGLDVSVQIIPPGQMTRAGAMRILLQDHSAEADALGYHTDDGFPQSYVAVADARADGSNWTVTLSHEAWEMAVDPTIDRTVQYTDAAGITWEAPVEACDCCEDDQFAVGYQGNDHDVIVLTAIALPSWFDPAGVAPFTEPPIPAIDAPFRLAEGGYIGRREIAPHVTDWQQVFAQGARTGRQRKGPRSRTARRFTA